MKCGSDMNRKCNQNITFFQQCIHVNGYFCKGIVQACWSQESVNFDCIPAHLKNSNSSGSTESDHNDHNSTCIEKGTSFLKARFIPHTAGIKIKTLNL